MATSPRLSEDSALPLTSPLLQMGPPPPLTHPPSAQAEPSPRTAQLPQRRPQRPPLLPPPAAARRRWSRHDGTVVGCFDPLHDEKSCLACYRRLVGDSCGFQISTPPPERSSPPQEALKWRKKRVRCEAVAPPLALSGATRSPPQQRRLGPNGPPPLCGPSPPSEAKEATNRSLGCPPPVACGAQLQPTVPRVGRKKACEECRFRRARCDVGKEGGGGKCEGCKEKGFACSHAFATAKEALAEYKRLKVEMLVVEAGGSG
jgi:hypothetical protein